MPVRPLDLGLRSRGGTYTLVITVVIGLLTAGLAIPYLFGEPLDTSTSTGPLVPRDTAASPSDATPAADGDASAPELSGPSSHTADGEQAGTAQAGTDGPADAVPAAGSTLQGSTASSPLAASDRGVTATTVTVAFLIVELGGVSQFGFSVPGFDPETQKGYVRAFVDHVNAGGGVGGRKIEPRFFLYDPTDPSSGQAACRAATQDNEIFAAVDIGSALDFPGQLCFTEQNATPLVEFGGFGTTQEMYDRSEGRLVTTLPSGVRSLANTAHELVDRRLLDGTRIGIIDRDFPGTVQTVTDGMVATLARRGHEVRYRADLSSDNGVAASQVPVAVQQMRANGVDAVFLLMDFITATQVVQTAERSGYTPAYFVSDFGAMTNDISLSAMPPSFRAVGITTMRTGEWRIGAPEPAVDAACRQIYAAAASRAVDRSEQDYGGALQACGMVDLFVRGAAASGPQLTRDGWVASVQRIGAIDYPNFGGLSFTSGKLDGADAIRLIQFEASCPARRGGREAPCWMPQGAFRPPHY